MADPIQFCGSNQRLTAPPGQEDVIRTLHTYANGLEHISCWKLNPTELAQVLKTGEVWVSVASGKTAPPIYLSGTALMQGFDFDTGEETDYFSDGSHLVEDARRFAALHHGEQKYGDHPYHYHTTGVVDILRSYGADWRFLTAGHLHDLEEDCFQDLPITERRQVIANRYGGLIESIVWACTGQMYIDGVKQERPARNAEQYAKIEEMPHAAPVKCADRIFNEEECARTESPQGLVYLDEAMEFDDKVGALCPPELRTRHLRAALAIIDYAGETEKTKRADLEARVDKVESSIISQAA